MLMILELKMYNCIKFNSIVFSISDVGHKRVRDEHPFHRWSAVLFRDDGGRGVQGAGTADRR